MRRDARRHDTAAVQKHEGARTQDWWEHQPHKHVLTIDGPGRVIAVHDGPYPGSEEYEVELDGGLGGGRYGAGQITGAASVEASGHHTADQDYPELGNLLHERPDPATLKYTASLEPHEIAQGFDKARDYVEDKHADDLTHVVNWDPLHSSSLKPEEHDGWMFMEHKGPRSRIGSGQTPPLTTYKHGISREHLHLDPDGGAYTQMPGGKYAGPRAAHDELRAKGHYHLLEQLGATQETKYNDAYKVDRNRRLQDHGYSVVEGSLQAEARSINGEEIDQHGTAPDRVRADDPNGYDQESTEGEPDPSWLDEIDQREQVIASRDGMDCYIGHDGPCPTSLEPLPQVRSSHHLAMPSKRHPNPPTGYSSLVTEMPGRNPETGWSNKRLEGFQDGELAGHIDFHAHPRGEALRVDSMHTHKHAQGQGIASAMMDDLYDNHPDAWVNHGWRTDLGLRWWRSYEDPAPDRNVHKRHPSAGWGGKHGYFRSSDVAHDLKKNNFWDPGHHDDHGGVPDWAHEHDDYNPREDDYDDRPDTTTGRTRMRSMSHKVLPSDDDPNRLREHLINHHGYTHDQLANLGESGQGDEIKGTHDLEHDASTYDDGVAGDGFGGGEVQDSLVEHAHDPNQQHYLPAEMDGLNYLLDPGRGGRTDTGVPDRPVDHVKDYDYSRDLAALPGRMSSLPSVESGRSHNLQWAMDVRDNLHSDAAERGHDMEWKGENINRKGYSPSYVGECKNCGHTAVAGVGGSSSHSHVTCDARKTTCEGPGTKWKTEMVNELMGQRMSDAVSQFGQDVKDEHDKQWLREQGFEASKTAINYNEPGGDHTGPDEHGFRWPTYHDHETGEEEIDGNSSPYCTHCDEWHWPEDAHDPEVQKRLDDDEPRNYSHDYTKYCGPACQDGHESDMGHGVHFHHTFEVGEPEHADNPEETPHRFVDPNSENPHGEPVGRRDSPQYEHRDPSKEGRCHYCRSPLPYLEKVRVGDSPEHASGGSQHSTDHPHFNGPQVATEQEHRRPRERGSMPMHTLSSLLITAAMDTDFRFQITAAWKDVQNKAKRIRSEGGVEITHATDGMVIGNVKGDHNVYEAGLQRMPGKRTSVATYSCGCKWGAYHWGADDDMSRFAGRMCSHALALQYEAQSRGMFGRDVEIDDTKPKWVPKKVVVKYDIDSGQHMRAESSLPEAMPSEPTFPVHAPLMVLVALANDDDPALPTLTAAVNDMFGDTSGYSEPSLMSPMGPTVPWNKDESPASAGTLKAAEPSNWGSINGPSMYPRIASAISTEAFWDIIAEAAGQSDEGAEATLHDEPEGALPETDGTEHTATADEARDADLSPEEREARWPELTASLGDVEIAESHDISALPGDALSPENLSMQTQGSVADIVAEFQRSAAAQNIMNGSGKASSNDGFDIAAAAEAHLAKTAANFSPAERQALINESPGTQASNTDRLDIAGTHYAEIDALDPEGDDDGWLM